MSASWAVAEKADLERELATVRQQLAAMRERAEAAENALTHDVSSGAEFLDLATAELQRSERILRTIFAGASDAMFLVDDEGRFVDMNPAACVLLGQTKSALLRRGVGDFADNDPSASHAMFAKLKEVGQMEARGHVRRANGVRRAVAMTAVANIGSGLHFVVIRDVTDESRAAESLARTEEELRRNDARFRAMVEKSAEAIGLLTTDARILYISRHSHEFFGLPPEELIGTSAFDWIYPDDKMLVASALADEATSGAPIEFRIVNRDGEVRWLESVVSNLVDDPAIGAIVANIRDVTERHLEKQERERLIDSLTFERGRLGALLEKAPAFMAVLRGEDLVFELANEAYLDLVDRRDIVGKRMRDAVPEFEAQGFIALIGEVLRSGEPWVAKGLLVNVTRGARKSEQRFVNAVIQALVEADGTRSGVFVHGVDVTEETAAQRRIRAQFNGVPVPTYAWQRVEVDGQIDFRLLDFNDAAVTVSHGKISAFRGHSVREVAEESGSLVEDMTRCIESGKNLQREDERTLLSGGKRRLLVTYAFAPPDVVLAHVEDITDRRKLEEQLRQAQKMEAVGRLAGGVAHDFNNLLSVVLSYTTLALEDLSPDNPLHGDLEQVKLAGDRAVELTRQLLAFSRQQVLQPRLMSISDTVLGLEKMLRRLLGEDIDLRLDLQSRALVEADPGQMEQVIMNLVINARDAMPEGGTLTVQVADVGRGEPISMEPVTLADAPSVSLCVSDTGHGMDEATRGRIFEPFFTTKGAGKGTGLGLATVFGIVQQSGGSINVQSRPGETTFHVYFPQSVRTDHAVSAAPHGGAPRGGSETILVVEDEAPLRALAVTVLRRSGYDVLEASNGEDALAVAGACTRKIDLLLTDVVMPRMNGRVLSDRLSAARLEMKTLFMSGYTDDAAVLQRVLASKVAFLQKPLTPDLLLRKVRDVLDES